MSTNNTERDIDQEWETRVLCSDETCIGVIGPDGRCKECGRPYEGELPLPSSASQTDPITSGDAADENPATVETDDAGEGTDDEWAQRKLCSDESCIGVIGPDGRCKECGRPYEP